MAPGCRSQRRGAARDGGRWPWLPRSVDAITLPEASALLACALARGRKRTARTINRGRATHARRGGWLLRPFRSSTVHQPPRRPLLDGPQARDVQTLRPQARTDPVKPPESRSEKRFPALDSGGGPRPPTSPYP